MERAGTLCLGRLGEAVHRRPLVLEAATTIGSTCEAVVVRGNTTPISHRMAGTTPEASDGPRRCARREREGAQLDGHEKKTDLLNFLKFKLIIMIIVFM